MRSLFELLPLRVCGNILESKYADIAETVWYCLTCKKQQEVDRNKNDVKVFLRYVDDIVRTVKGDPGVVLEDANKLHPNVQFTIEELDSNGNLAFLDLNVNVDSGKKVTCGWFQKPTENGSILNFRGCAPLQYKKTLLKGRFMGYSEVPQHGKISTTHWKKSKKNGLKIKIRKIGRTR